MGIVDLCRGKRRAQIHQAIKQQQAQQTQGPPLASRDLAVTGSVLQRSWQRGPLGKGGRKHPELPLGYGFPGVHAQLHTHPSPSVLHC